jgi:hypothetical protein
MAMGAAQFAADLRIGALGAHSIDGMQAILNVSFRDMASLKSGDDSVSNIA